MKGIRDSVSSSSFKYIEIDEDVSPTERPIAVTTRKAYSRVAVVGGGCIVFVLFLLLFAHWVSSFFQFFSVYFLS